MEDLRRVGIVRPRRPWELRGMTEPRRRAVRPRALVPCGNATRQICVAALAASWAAPRGGTVGGAVRQSSSAARESAIRFLAQHGMPSPAN
jgi:hypothetical protein